MSDQVEQLKKELAEALRTFDIDISDELTDKKESLEEDQKDYEEMSLLTRKKMDELSEEGEKIIVQSGMSREALQAFGNNPNNFSKEQWEALQKIKEVSAEYKKMTIEDISASLGVSEEKLSKGTKKQKGRRPKKKHWIPL